MAMTAHSMRCRGNSPNHAGRFLSETMSFTLGWFHAVFSELSSKTSASNMAASSGITVGAELAQAFASACSEAKTRVFKIELQGETLVCSSSIHAKSSDADDFTLVQSVLVEKQACYICYRTDAQPPCNWVFMMYVPNGTTVRDRMLYAATREVR
jgi:hypothetical protein